MIGGQVEGNALLHTPKSPQPLVCVECGEYVSSLFVEFSEGSIKLTRCVSKIVVLL